MTSFIHQINFSSYTANVTAYLKWDKQPFWGAVLKIYLFATYWVNLNDENIEPNKISQPIGQYILTVTENKRYVWNYGFSGPTNIYLFEFSYINNKIKSKICSKLTREAPDIVLVSLLFILNIFDMF